MKFFLLYRGRKTFMSRKNFMLSWVEHEKSFITSGPGPLLHWLHHLIPTKLFHNLLIIFSNSLKVFKVICQLEKNFKRELPMFTNYFLNYSFGDRLTTEVWGTSIHIIWCYFFGDNLVTTDVGLSDAIISELSERVTALLLVIFVRKQWRSWFGISLIYFPIKFSSIELRKIFAEKSSKLLWRNVIVAWL